MSRAGAASKLTPMFVVRRARLRRLANLHVLLALLSLLLLLPRACGAASTKTAAVSGSETLQIDTPERVLHDHMQPHFAPGRSGIVELFEWKFADIAAECEQFLGPMGYAAVQVSPVMEHVVMRNDTLQRPWWERYQPISYRIATRSGDEQEFLAMTRACDAAGVRVYVDVVLNHMAGAYDEQTARGSELLTGTADSTANASAFDYPAVPYTREDFHKPCALEDYSDAHVVRNCQWERCPDLDHSRLHVRHRLTELLNRLVELGVAGFRVDTAKYIWPIDIKLIFKEVQNLNSTKFDLPENSRPFVYQSVVDMGIDAISKTEYASYGVVSDYLYAAELSTILSGKAPLSTLINWGPAMGFLPHQYSLVFVDSHDGQRVRHLLGRNRLLSYKRPRAYMMATLFMLAHPYGRVKRLMSSYFFAADHPEQGPPVHEDNDEIIRSPEFDAVSGQCTRASGWVCEHRWPPIARMVALVNGLHEVQDGVINFQTDGPYHVAFCRGRKAFIALNSDFQLTYAAKVQTCLAAGVYCDVISGGRTEDGSGCVGKRVEVDAEGYAEIQLPVALHLDVGVGGDYGNDADDAVEKIDWNGEFGVLAIHEGARLQGGGSTSKPTVAENAGEQRDSKEEIVTKYVSPELVEILETERNARIEDGATDASVEEEEAQDNGEEANDAQEAAEEEEGREVEEANADDDEVAGDEEKDVEKGKETTEEEEEREVEEANSDDEELDVKKEGDEGKDDEEMDYDEEKSVEEASPDEEAESETDNKDSGAGKGDDNDEEDGPDKPVAEAEPEEADTNAGNADSDNEQSKGVDDTNDVQNDEPAEGENVANVDTTMDNDDAAKSLDKSLTVEKRNSNSSGMGVHSSLHYGSLAIAPITMLFNLRAH